MDMIQCLLYRIHQLMRFMLDVPRSSTVRLYGGLRRKSMEPGAETTSRSLIDSLGGGGNRLGSTVTTVVIG